MEVVWFHVELGHLGRRYFYAGGIGSLCQFCPDSETGFGLGVAYQVNHGLIADQRSCPPILRDEREHPVFNLVPLAGSGWKMRHLDAQAGEIRQML